MAPECRFCGRRLDRIDHVGVEHYIFDNNIYRDVGIADGDGLGGEFGLASETTVQCGYCGMPVERDAAAFFYERWIRVLEITDERSGT